MNLTGKEIKVFKLLVETSMDNGGDFGFTDEVDHDSIDINSRSFAGIVGSLAKKELVEIDSDEYPGQYNFSCTAIPVMTELGLDWTNHDHLNYCEQ